MAVLKFCNQGGFPCLEVVGKSTTGTVTTFSFNSHPFRNTNRFYGGFYVKFPLVDEDGTNTVEFTTVGEAGSTIKVYDKNGSLLPISKIANAGSSIHGFFYDRDTNKVQFNF